MAILNTLKFILNHPLTSSNKMGALSRFMKWQIGSRLNPYPIVYPFVAGTNLVIERGMTGATGNLYTGLHEFSDMAFLLHFLREKDLFIDIGANIGSYTILASGVCKANSITIEPSSKTFKRLLRNISINNLGDLVTPFKIGLGAKKSVKYFTKTLDTINHVVTNVESTENTEEIRIDTLDIVLGEVKQPLLLKIDVEGFETEVLQGSLITLRNPMLKAIIIELNGSGARYGFDEKYIHELLRKEGFNPFSYNPFQRTLEERASFGDQNIIYIRDTEFVTSRIASSPKINVLGKAF